MKKVIGLFFCVKAFDLGRGTSDGSRACSEQDQDRKSLCESVCNEVVAACVTKCGGFDGDQSRVRSQNHFHNYAKIIRTIYSEPDVTQILSSYPGSVLCQCMQTRRLGMCGCMSV